MLQNNDSLSISVFPSPPPFHYIVKYIPKVIKYTILSLEKTPDMFDTYW